MVSGSVPPLIEDVQIRLEGSAAGESVQLRLQREAETVEVLDNVAEAGIAAIQLAAGRKLRLEQDLERCTDLGSDDLGVLGVEVTAEALEVRVSSRT